VTTYFDEFTRKKENVFIIDIYTYYNTILKRFLTHHLFKYTIPAVEESNSFTAHIFEPTKHDNNSKYYLNTSVFVFAEIYITNNYIIKVNCVIINLLTMQIKT
jgi:hypothetical protein